jgi:hypothetical protein
MFVAYVLAAASWLAAALTGHFAAIPAAILTTGLALISTVRYLRGGSHSSSSLAAPPDESAVAVDVLASPSEVSHDATLPPGTPDSLDGPSVLRALLVALSPQLRASGAQLWAWDETAGILRAAAEFGSPALTPSEREDDSLVYVAHDQGSAVLEPVSRVTAAARSDTFWRYAVPIASAGVRGVLTVDIDSDERPDSATINRTVAWYRVALAASLVLHDAEAREQASHSLMSMTRDLSEALEPGRVLDTTLTHAMSLVGAATGSIMLLDPVTSRLTIEIARGLPASVVENTSVAIGEGIAGWVAATEQPLMVEDLEHSSARGQRHGVRTALSVPLLDDEGIIGVLNVGSQARPARFTEHHRQTLAVFARHATAAWRTARAVHTSQDIHFETLKALALAMETKDPYAAGGTERVMALASQLGQILNLAAEEQSSLELASMLHDIGMDLVLDGAGPGTRPLSTVERGMLAMHPSVAADILSQAPALRGVVPIVFHHHEHFDGNGYSGGVSGEGIPYGARILAVADAFVAMTSDRPYRRALSTRQALAELTDKAGTQFDPVVVEALVDLVGSESDRVPHREQ